MAHFPYYRPRRMRTNEAMRSLVRENELQVTDLMYPIFVVAGENIKEEISSLPGTYHFSVDRVLEVVQQAWDLGIKGIILFGLPSYKDDFGSSAWDENEPVQTAVRLIKDKFPELVVATDVCLCQYTEHGHCGQLTEDGEVLNDATLSLLEKVAVSHAQAGADIVAPSDMMDGRVLAIRQALDQHYFENVAIMAYSAKYASAYYGPFRAAVSSAPKQGDRKSYQMDPANSLEALRETELDIQEGADIIMVKPALAYLDIVAQMKAQFNRPLAVYNVSGEYAMIKAAAKMGLVDEEKITLETLLSMKRAGAKIIITYHALDVARWLQNK